MRESLMAVPDDLETGLESIAVTSKPQTLGGRLRSPLALILGAGLLVVLGVTMGLVLGRSTSNEGLAAPRQTAAVSGAAGAPAISAELEMLRKEVEREDAPSKKLLAFAHLALDEGQLPAAIWAYKRVLAREPRNVEAITHMGLILYQGKHLDEALARIEEAIRLDPKYAHAHWDRANLLLTGKKDYAAAQEALGAFLALVPSGPDADRARAMLAEARRQLAAGGRRG
jgi:tetratricopeptide (TPR) repeat protein